MMVRKNSPDLGPLFTVSEDELSRPARRREDRDVLVLRIEVEAQRREVARLREIVASGEARPHEPPIRATAKLENDPLLLTSRDLRNTLGISAGTLYRWVKDGSFPRQIHVGSLARWTKAEVDAWLQARTEARARNAVSRDRPEGNTRVRGGRSRWAPTTASQPEITERGTSWKPQPTPLRGVGWRLPPGIPQPVSSDHADYTVPRFGLEDAARYVGLPLHRQWDLRAIPHGRTRAMHYCFAQSDLDAFLHTLRQKPAKGSKAKPGPA
jgi:prophage regulatory protein